ncbi:MAG: radical SAM family heme chaperone HemW, partial [Bacteroidota bacterium]
MEAESSPQTSKKAPPSGAGRAGLYIHVPFCKQACHYCDFHFSTSLKHRNQMLSAMAKEIELRKDELGDITIETIYFGGGTPSILTIEELNFLIKTVYQNFKVSEGPEITLEANPDDLISSCSNENIVRLSAVEAASLNTFQAYKSIGINRLSIGVQSFFEEDLKLMNRAHNANEAEECIKEATKYFDNISIDLIYGIPSMDNKRWQRNIEIALDFGIPHISSYALTVEPKTALKTFIDKGVIADVDDEQAEAQFQILIETLEAADFIHYELSNFGKEGFFSRNNKSYWQGKPYLGIGPSAHSFSGEIRSWNIRNNVKYIKAIQAGTFPKEQETLSLTDRYNEYVMTGLRTIWGVSLEKVQIDFGLQYKKYLLEQAEPLINEHLLYIDENKLLVARKSKFLSDGIASKLFKLN